MGVLGLDYGDQLFGQMLLQMFAVKIFFKRVINIYKQLAFRKADWLPDCGGTYPIS